MACLFLWLLSLSAGSIEQTSSLPETKKLSQDILVVSEVDDLNRAPAFIKWKSIKGASYYKVFTTRSADFSGAREYRTSRSYMHFVGFVNERYYWKVVAFHKNGQRLSDGPEAPFTFIIDYSADK